MGRHTTEPSKLGSPKRPECIRPDWSQRNSTTLLAQECEICGSKENIVVHHIRSLKDVTKSGRRKKPAWKEQMAARHKTLVVCSKCHSAIHYGHPIGSKIALNKLADKSSSNLQKNSV